MTQTELGQFAADGGTDYEPETEKPSYWDKYYGDVEFVNAMEVHEPLLEEMEQEFDDTSWISQSDVTRPWDFRHEDPDDVIEAYNERQREKSNVTLTFPNYRIAVLWMCEITGQISDGAWENKQWRHGTWKTLSYAQIEVDEELDEAEGEARFGYDNLGYVRQLRKHDGHEERMIYYVRASGLDDDYDESDLLADLQALKGINN